MSMSRGHTGQPQANPTNDIHSREPGQPCGQKGASDQPQEQRKSRAMSHQLCQEHLDTARDGDLLEEARRNRQWDVGINPGTP